ncbi:MAG: VOC family protein [Thermoplasmatota archaeon]
MKLKLIYAGIRVRDFERSLRFYTDALGLEALKRGEAADTGGKWATLRSPEGKTVLELNWYPPGSAFGEAYVNGSELDHLGFSVDDLPNAVRALEAHGAKLVRGGGPGATSAFLTDPDGIWIELLAKPGA